MIKQKVATIVTLAVVLTIPACGKSENKSSSGPTSSSSAQSQTAEVQSVPSVKDVVPTPAEKDPVSYRAVSATLRGTDQKIQIMVPEDVDVSTGRLIEYRQDDDGVYYYKSVIPQ